MSARSGSAKLHGFLFRRSFKLGPFGRVYLGKKGASLSIGRRGAHVNVGPRGTRVSVGLPGTGVSYSQKLGSSKRTVATASTRDSADAVSTASGCFTLAVVLAAFGVFAAGLNSYPVTTLIISVAAIWAWFHFNRKATVAARATAAAAVAAERARLSSLYGDENVSFILAGRPWVGCSRPMLLEMLGDPVSTDEAVLRTKTKHTYKYRQFGQNRFGLKVFLEDDVVTGWEEKDEP